MGEVVELRNLLKQAEDTNIDNLEELKARFEKEREDIIRFYETGNNVMVCPQPGEKERQIDSVSRSDKQKLLHIWGRYPYDKAARKNHSEKNDIIKVITHDVTVKLSNEKPNRYILANHITCHIVALVFPLTFPAFSKQ